MQNKEQRLRISGQDVTVRPGSSSGGVQVHGMRSEAELTRDEARQLRDAIDSASESRSDTSSR